LTETIGFIAAFLTTTAFLPQFIKVWRTRSTQDISLRMYLLLCAGVLLWLAYGVRLHSLPIILANGITFGLAVGIVGLKLRFDRRPGSGSAGGPPRRASTGEVAPARPPR